MSNPTEWAKDARRIAAQTHGAAASAREASANAQSAISSMEAAHRRIAEAQQVINDAVKGIAAAVVRLEGAAAEVEAAEASVGIARKSAENAQARASNAVDTSDAATGALGVLATAMEAWKPPAPQPDPDPDPEQPPPPPVPMIGVPGGFPVYVRVPDAMLDGSRPHTADYLWEWGDGGSILRGYCAAHIYESPGDYEIKLNGKPFAVARVSPVQVVYVSTYAQLAARLAEDTTSIIGVRSDIDIGTGTIKNIRGRHLVMGEGTRLTGAPGRVMFEPPMDVPLGISGFFVDTAPPGPLSTSAGATLLSPSHGSWVRSNTFGLIGAAVNGNRMPRRVYVDDNSVAGEASLMNNFVWAEGEEWTITRNTVPNSVFEHCVRIAASNSTRPGCKFITLWDNEFTNLDLREEPGGNPRDYAKGTIVMQVGSYGWAEGNRLSPNGGVGPLGEGDGLTSKHHRWQYARWQNNVFSPNRTTDAVEFRVEHGAEYVHTRDNEYRTAVVEGYNEEYGRGNRDISMQDDVFSGPPGRILLHVYGPVDGLTITRPEFVVSGPAATYPSPPLAFETGWRDSYRMEAPVLPAVGSPARWPRANMMARVSDQNTAEGYLSREEFLALPRVTRAQTDTPGG